MRKNLLIGTITVYNWNEVTPFFNSYMKAGFENCDCVMFVENMTNRTIEKIKSCGVQVYPTPEYLGKYRIVDYRWKVYEDFINANPEKYDMVYTTDVRDVIFQRDLFKDYEGHQPFLGVAVEDGIFSTEKSGHKDFFIGTYGLEAYEKYKNERIICMGTVGGTASEFCEFCRIMWEILSSERIYHLEHVEHVAGCDQAVANYLLYNDKLFNDILLVSDNKTGHVMTIGITEPEDVKLDAEGRVLNGEGKIAAVVHQYDRKPEVIKVVLKKYSEGMSFFSRFVLKHNNNKFIHFCKRLMNFVHRESKRGNLFNSLAGSIYRRLGVKKKKS